jgi:hypothetical protein
MLRTRSLHADSARGKIQLNGNSHKTTMTTKKQSAKKRLNMAERAQQQLERHFPEFEPAWLWLRTVNSGFTTLPRTLPIVMQAIDARTKGQPAGHTLFCLWARSPDHPLITIENPATFAAEAGFFGERAVHTWRRRMKQLVDLNFIMAKKSTSGDYHYVLLLNPNAAMEHMNERGLVQTDLYGRFVDRVTDIGAVDDISDIHAFWEEQREGETAPKKSVRPGKITKVKKPEKTEVAPSQPKEKSFAPQAPKREGPPVKVAKAEAPRPPAKKESEKTHAHKP